MARQLLRISFLRIVMHLPSINRKPSGEQGRTPYQILIFLTISTDVRKIRDFADVNYSA